MARLVELGWYPFSDLSGKCPIDILAWKDGQIRSFQVKATNAQPRPGSYEVQLRSVRPNKTKNVIKPFDNTQMDYLAVYVAELEKVLFFKASGITNKTAMIVKAEMQSDDVD